MKLISGRAGYEQMRIPVIRGDLIEEWDAKGESDVLKAHMLAERLATI